MKHFFRTVLLAMLFVTCKSSVENKVDLIALTQQIVGVYEASLPCNGCISIEYQLELESDSTFIEHISYLGNPDGNYEVHGKWGIESDSLITLYPGRLAYKIKANANGSLTITDAIENHLESQPAILERLGTVQKTDAAVLLNDIWVLEAIHQTEVAEADYDHERPRLEFQKAEGKVTGTTGCNQLMGTYTTQGNNIAFGPMALTKRACPGNLEDQFIQALHEVSGFTIANLKLYLLSGSAEKLRFRKVD